jgi:hypothetical protein
MVQTLGGDAVGGFMPVRPGRCPALERKATVEGGEQFALIGETGTQSVDESVECVAGARLGSELQRYRIPR